MRGIFRRALCALAVLMLLAGHIQPAAARLVEISGSGRDPLVQCARIQEDSSDSLTADEISEDEITEDAGDAENMDASETVEDEGNTEETENGKNAGNAQDVDAKDANGREDKADDEAGNGTTAAEAAADVSEPEPADTGADKISEGDSAAVETGEDEAAASGGILEEAEDVPAAGEAFSEKESIKVPPSGAGSTEEGVSPEEGEALVTEADTQEQVVTARMEGASDAEPGSPDQNTELFGNGSLSGGNGTVGLNEDTEDPVITLSGELPEGAQVVAQDAQRQAEEAGLKDVLCAYDITINDGWQPEEALVVSIALEGLPEQVRVYHIGEDGAPEKVETVRSEEGEVVFLAEGFSIYAVTEEVFRRTYEFMDYKYGNYFPYEFTVTMPEDPDDPNQGVIVTSRQILRNGDSLTVPSLPNKDGLRFLGWYTSPSADVNEISPERGGVKKDIKSNSIVTLYARYGLPAVLTFYTRPEGTASNQVFSTRTVYLPESGGSTQVDLTEEIHPEPPVAGQGFSGWKVAGADALPDQEKYAVSGDVSLYPCYESMHEVVFSREDEKEEYIAPLWVGEDGVSGKLTDRIPLRNGYAFEGWAADGVLLTDGEARLLADDIDFNGGTLRGGVLRLDRDIELHSVWRAEEVQYRVIFWCEKASDTKKLTLSDGVWSVPEEKREYDFMGTLRVAADAGAAVSLKSLEDAYGKLAGNPAFLLDEGEADFTGLVFDTIKDSANSPFESITVDGDGEGVVHVYYDREVVTLRFDYPDDVAGNTAVEEPSYYPALPASGTVTQKAVTMVSRADYPDDFVLVGLYGGQISDGVSQTGEASGWPVSYTAENLSYTVTTRTMQYSGGKWTQKSASTAQASEASRTIPTRWLKEDGSEEVWQETFGLSAVLTPSQTLSTLCLESSGSTVTYYKENEQAAYPASAVYSSSAALTYSAVSGETVVVESPFEGFELDFFTYSDSRGTPIRGESDATVAERTLTGGSFTNLKVYCKREVHHVIFHNGSGEPAEGPGVKYGMSLATDYVKQYVTVPDLPAELSGREDEVEFAGWFMDAECTIYLDFSGIKAAARARLMMQYDQIQTIYSVYDYKPSGGTAVPAIRIEDGDLHLFAGWMNRRFLVQVEPDGGELPSDVPTYFWKNYGETLGVFFVSRDYVPAQEESEGDHYLYHIHTYEQAQKDNDTSDRSARYVPASDGDAGTKYVHEPDSYRFLGWFLVTQTANGSESLRPYDHENPLTGDVKLRAQWSRLGVYRVSYEAGEHGTLDGEAGSPAYRDHATIALNGAVTPDDGYVFTGWKIRRPGTADEYYDTLYSSGDELVISADQAQITMDEYAGEPRGVITLVAQYEPLRGTSITYYANGGVFTVTSEAETGSDPELIRMLQERLIRDYGEKASHHFVYDADGVIIGYTISGIEQNANLITEDGTAFERTGYKLMGWSSTPDGAVELGLNVDGYNAASDPDGTGHVFYAVWKPEKQVVYDLRGGTWNTANGSEYRQEEGYWIYGAGDGEQAPIPKAPSKEGYAFVGWHNQTTAKKGLAVMPTVTKNITLYAVWTTDVVLKFDTGGGEWEAAPDGLWLVDKGIYGVTVTAGKDRTLPTEIPVREGGYLFHCWQQGSYHYNAGVYFKTGAEQGGQTLTFTADWSEGVEAVEVLVGADDSVTVEDTGSLIGASEDGSAPEASREIEGYQYLFTVYDEIPENKDDIVEHYKVTSLVNLGENTYRVELANGQTRTHYPGSAEKLQAVYIQDRQVDVRLVRMNVYEDGQDNMNLTLTSLRNEPWSTLDVGKVSIKDAFPNPKSFIKPSPTSYYTSFTYAIGHRDAESMYAIDTMTQTSLWIRQTLNGFAFSVNGDEWKELDREEGSGKDVAVYIIYDSRVETPTTINHTVYGLKSDKEKLITYQVYVKGRWGFNIGNAAYFLNKPDDPSEELNSYTVVLHDGENVLIPLHIDYLTGQKQYYVPGDLFYDMFGNDYPTTITNQSELRIWQEVEMRRKNELPFTDGTFETSIQMTCTSSSSYHNLFNGYDKENHLWLKQLGISKMYINSFSHSFIYTRTSLDVPLHVLELTRDGYVLRDEEWLIDGKQNLSVTANALTVDATLAGSLVNAPEGYGMQFVHYGLSEDDLEGTDDELVLRLAADRSNETLYHVYDYASAEEAADSTTRSLVPDGSEIYLIYTRQSSTDVPVEYVKLDSSGAYIPVDLGGYGLSAPEVTVTAAEAVDFRSLSEVEAVNEGVRKLDALYLTGRILLADQKGNLLATYQPGANGDWGSGRAVELQNSEAGVIYTADDGTQKFGSNVKVWIEVANNSFLRIMGRLWQRGSFSTNTGVIPYLPEDEEGRIVADGVIDERNSLSGGIEPVGEEFAAFKRYIPYATDPEAEYLRCGMGTELSTVYSVAYCTDENGYRHWYYQVTEGSAPVRVSQILYADYVSLYSPVNVRFVLPVNTGGYMEAEDLEEDVRAQLVKTIRVDRNGTLLSDELAASIAAIDGNSALYRTTGTFALGSADLRLAYFTSENADIRLTDTMEGLVYAAGEETGTLDGGNFPDVYVVLRPIVTLTVTKVIDDAGGYAHWDDDFAVTIRLTSAGSGTAGGSSGSVSLDGEYPAVLTCDGSLSHAAAVDEGDSHPTVTFDGGTAQVTLRHGQSLAIPGLPRGTLVSVTEQMTDWEAGIYRASYQIVEGAKVTKGNSFQLNRHARVEITNTSVDITDTGKDFADSPALALLLCGGALYAVYLLLLRKKKY